METSLLKLLEKEAYLAAEFNCIVDTISFFERKLSFTKGLPDSAGKDCDIFRYSSDISGYEETKEEKRKQLSSARSEISAHLKMIMEV